MVDFERSVLIPTCLALSSMEPVKDIATPEGESDIWFLINGPILCGSLDNI